MAVSPGTTSSSLNAAIEFSNKYWYTGFQKSTLGVMMNSGAVVASKDFADAKAGSLISVHTFANMSGGFVGESQTLEGNENVQVDGNYRVQFNETWDAARIPGKLNIRQMRDTIDFDKPTLKALFDKQTAASAISFHQQAAGVNQTSIAFNGVNFTGANRTHITGHNIVTAPSSSRIYRPAGQTTDEGLSSTGQSAAMSTAVLDEVGARIGNTGGRDAASSFNTLDGNWVIGALSPRQMLDLLNDAGSAMQIYQNQLSIAAGGDAEDLTRGSMFGTRAYTYKSFILYEDPFVSKGINSSTSVEIDDVRRAVFVGARALCYATPFDLSPTANADEYVPLVPVVEDFDYNRFIGHAVGKFDGLRTFVDANGTTANVFVVPTYAAEF